MVIGAGLCAPPARAAYTLTLEQVGGNVVATGSGTLDLAGLTLVQTETSAPPAIIPLGGQILIGSAPASYHIYRLVTGPTSFGGGGDTVVSSGSGDDVGISSDDAGVFVPLDYLSGATLLSTATWDGQTLASLGATPGTYVWNWGSGPTADTFTLDIGTAAVPEPAGILLLALPLGLVMLLAQRSCRTQHSAA